MANKDYLKTLDDILTNRMQIDREACAELEGKEVTDIIDGECAACGEIYYSDYLMPNFQNEDELGKYVEELCISCHLSQS
jgi:hypothetical protein